MVKIEVTDGIPVRLHGTKKRGKSSVKFVHKCCDCGLRHDVVIKHDGKVPHVDITFTRTKAVVKNEEEQAVCSTKSPWLLGSVVP